MELEILKQFNQYLANGINRIILGSKVLKDREFIRSIDQAERKSLAIDIAIKDGQLAGRWMGNNHKK